MGSKTSILSQIAASRFPWVDAVAMCNKYREQDPDEVKEKWDNMLKLFSQVQK